MNQDKKVMTMTEYEEHQKKLIEESTHDWVMDSDGEFWEEGDEDRVDTFAWSEGFHNGPVCKACNYMPCQHCEGLSIRTACQEHNPVEDKDKS